MQVNNSTSPSFRALIIEQGARNSLKECNMSQLTKVQEAGNLLKDTKFYNVRIDEKLKCHLEVAKDKFQDFFFGLFKPTKFFERVRQGSSDNIILFDTLYGVSKLGGKHGIPTFNLWGYVGGPLGINDIDGLSKIAKELDIASEQKFNEKMTKKFEDAKMQEAINTKVDDLLNKFSR